MESKIIQKIIDYIKEHDVLYDYDTFEQMPIIRRYAETDCLEGLVNKDSYTAFLTNLAMMYVNQGILFAKSNLTKDEFDDYIIYFAIEYNEQELKENGFVMVDVFFSRKAKEHMKWFTNIIDIAETEIYGLIKDIVGISDYDCYCLTNDEEDTKAYCFVPRR